ncbi:hypothetical protein [Paenibacillus endoradicis]|uniref:hypothetical protein n=1 Tax=Paenibacillus endoradicis TaxID=2972487 RepID=UPI00215991E2|nr:hypothetical protein [Paenibacillus endoradicis]MCR8659300.1 hypothetical protein [Paenibacillus endoradicis]
MAPYGEWFIMIVAGILLLLLAYRWLYRWLHTAQTMSRIKLGKGGRIKEDDPNVTLLTKNGYIVISGRHTIPIAIELDDIVLDKATNVYVDYVVEKKGRMYLVKYERERHPMEWTNNEIRDRLLMYSLLVPDMSGIIYINYREGTLRKIAFHFVE